MNKRFRKIGRSLWAAFGVAFLFSVVPFSPAKSLQCAPCITSKVNASFWQRLVYPNLANCNAWNIRIDRQVEDGELKAFAQFDKEYAQLDPADPNYRLQVANLSYDRDQQLCKVQCKKEEEFAKYKQVCPWSGGITVSP